MSDVKKADWEEAAEKLGEELGKTATAHQTNLRDRLIEALLKRAKITLGAETEEQPIEGNFAYDTEEETRQAEQFVRDLYEHTEWGWCCVHVQARFAGFEGHDYLGCCSYRSEEDFRTNGDYESMAHEACSQLADELLSAHAAVNDLLGEAS